MYGNRNERFGNNSLTPPVREGEEIDVTIESVGEKGDGMTRIKGFVVFVPNTKAGERKRVKVTRVLSKVGFAEVIGDAQAAPSKPAPAPKEEFDPKEELDSEDFGEDSGSADEAEEATEEESDEDEQKE